MKDKKISQEILPEAMEINQLLQDVPQHTRKAAIELIKILTDGMHGYADKTE
ncbi:MAG: hypothetical protein ACI4LN_00035 [Anaerovoracaceae bacterium]